MTDGRIPLVFSPALALPDEQRARIAVVLTERGIDPPGFALVRHADGAATARRGSCACCRVPSDLVTVLRQLIIERARGEIEFAAVLVDGDDYGSSRQLRDDACADPFVNARYAISIPLE